MGDTKRIEEGFILYIDGAGIGGRPRWFKVLKRTPQTVVLEELENDHKCITETARPWSLRQHIATPGESYGDRVRCRIGCIRCGDWTRIEGWEFEETAVVDSWDATIWTGDPVEFWAL